MNATSCVFALAIILASIFIKGENQNHYKEMGFNENDITCLRNNELPKLQLKA